MSAGQEDEDMDQNQLLDRLHGLVPAQFDELVFRLRIPRHLLPEGAQSTVAINVIRYMVQQGRLHELEAYFLQGPAAPSLAARDARPAAGTSPMEVRIQRPAVPESNEAQIKILFLGANPLFLVPGPMLFLDSSQASGSLSKPVARLLPWVTNPRPG